MKSKKPSDTWKLLDSQCRYFLDRNQGNRILPELLRQAGMKVECHSDHFTDHQVADPVWIERCGREKWIIITGDKNIESDPINRQAVTAAK